MMREYWNLQENLMITAWKEGGEVDGKEVTDERLLNFWEQRRDSVSRDDPLWDYYNNLRDQYDFSIRESEVGLKYAQKKMSAGEVARWYSNEAKKYPRYSEVYRTIAGQAAKFLEAARASSRQSSYDRRRNTYIKLSNQNAVERLWPSQQVMGILTEAFRYYGVLGGSQNTSDPGDQQAAELGGGEELLDLHYGQGDQQIWQTILDVLHEPGTEIHDWFMTNVDAARRQGLDLELPLDQRDLEVLMQRSVEGFDRQIEIDKRFSDIASDTNADKLRGQKRDTVDVFQFLFALDEVSIYSQRRAALDQVRNDPTATPFDQLRAWNTYYDDLGRLITTVGDQNPVMTTALNSERRYILGDTTGGAPLVSEDALLAPFGNETQGGAEGASIAAQVDALRDTTEKLATGEYVAMVDPLTRQWNAIPISEIYGTYGSQFVIMPEVGRTTTFVPGTSAEDRLLGRGTVQQGAEVGYGIVYGTEALTAVAPSNPSPDPNTGEYLTNPLPAVNSVNLGQIARIPNADGTETTVYGIYVGGQIRWTTENPFLDSAVYRTQRTGDGTALVVDWDRSGAGVEIPIDPNDPTKGVSPGFDPRKIIDTSVVGQDSVFAFRDPSLAVLASTPAGRDRVAGMNPDNLINTLSNSPWIDWTNTAIANEVINDIGAIRASAATTAQGQAQAEFDFYRQLRETRTPLRPNIYLSAPDPTMFAINTYLEKGIKVAGFDLDMAGGTVTGFGYTVKDVLAWRARGNAAPSVGTPANPAPTAQNFQGTIAPGQQSGAGYNDPFGLSAVGMPNYTGRQSSSGSWGQGQASYGMPEIMTAGRLRLPAMPGTTGPTLGPTLGALSQPPLPVAPLPAPTPIAPRPVAPPPPPPTPVFRPPSAPRGPGGSAPIPIG